MPHGEIVEMELAERGYRLGEVIWVREVRRKCRSGHQTSVLSTDYRIDFTEIAAILSRRKVKFHNPHMRESELTPKEMEKYGQKKGELWDEIEFIKKELDLLKDERKQTKKHIPFEELPDEEPFHRIAPARKQLTNTVKMIAYRAETAMAQILRGFLGKKDDTRPLLRQVYSADVDLVPDESNNTLTVRLHRLANRQADLSVQALCDHLNKTETIYPGTEFKLNFELVSNKTPPIQEF